MAQRTTVLSPAETLAQLETRLQRVHRWAPSAAKNDELALLNRALKRAKNRVKYAAKRHAARVDFTRMSRADVLDSHYRDLTHSGLDW